MFVRMRSLVAARQAARERAAKLAEVVIEIKNPSDSESDSSASESESPVVQNWDCEITTTDSVIQLHRKIILKASRKFAEIFKSSSQHKSKYCCKVMAILLHHAYSQPLEHMSQRTAIDAIRAAHHYEMFDLMCRLALYFNRISLINLVHPLQITLEYRIEYLSEKCFSFLLEPRVINFEFHYLNVEYFITRKKFQFFSFERIMLIVAKICAVSMLDIKILSAMLQQVDEAIERENIPITDTTTVQCLLQNYKYVDKLHLEKYTDETILDIICTFRHQFSFYDIIKLCQKKKVQCPRRRSLRVPLNPYESGDVSMEVDTNETATT